MKFFLEFVSCCGSTERQAVPTIPPHAEEARSLMSRSYAGSDPLVCRKRGRRSNSVSSTQWRPSLCAISEENVVSVMSGKAERTARSGKKTTGKAGSSVKTRVCDHRANEFRRNPIPTFVPAFSPTAFLF